MSNAFVIIDRKCHPPCSKPLINVSLSIPLNRWRVPAVNPARKVLPAHRAAARVPRCSSRTRSPAARARVCLAPRAAYRRPSLSACANAARALCSRCSTYIPWFKRRPVRCTSLTGTRTTRRGWSGIEGRCRTRSRGRLRLRRARVTLLLLRFVKNIFILVLVNIQKQICKSSIKLEHTKFN